jgi:ferredoxin
MRLLCLRWPDGHTSQAEIGEPWLEAARKAGYPIPTGCLGGRCGACEIDVNGEPVRACVSWVEGAEGTTLEVDLVSDPYW